MVAFQVAGDLALSPDETQLLIVGGARMVEQQIRTASQIWRRYYRYDLGVGLPMLEAVLVKNADLRVVTQVFREWLATISGVVSVESVQCSLDSELRLLTVDFAVKCEDGSDLASAVTFEVG